MPGTSRNGPQLLVGLDKLADRLALWANPRSPGPAYNRRERFVHKVPRRGGESGLFGQRKARPTDSEFLHSEDCKTKGAEPQWGNEGDGTWSRTCSCRREIWRAPDAALDPNSQAARPASTAHRHAASCVASDVPAVVRIERRDGLNGWRSECTVCGSIWVYFWAPQMTDSSGRRLTREGPCLYQYELASQPAVPA
jgi:hypothetical protein